MQHGLRCRYETRELLKPQSVPDKVVGYKSLFTEWQAFLDHLEEMNVMDAYSIKPLINGSRLSQAIGAKPGMWMKEALDVCMAWQLRHPEASEHSGAIEEVRSRSEELKIPIENA